MRRVDADRPFAGNFVAVEEGRPAGEIVEVRGAAPRRRDGAPGQRPLRILIADDDRDTADSLAMLVTIWGHVSRVAYDGAEALTLALAEPPNVLLLDVGMSKLNGCNVVQALCQPGWFNDMRMIAITGYTGEAHRHRCLNAGFSHVLLKPVSPTTVEALLQYESDRLANHL